MTNSPSVPVALSQRQASPGRIQTGSETTWETLIRSKTDWRTWRGKSSTASFIGSSRVSAAVRGHRIELFVKLCGMIDLEDVVDVGFLETMADRRQIAVRTYLAP